MPSVHSTSFLPHLRPRGTALGIVLSGSAWLPRCPGIYCPARAAGGCCPFDCPCNAPDKLTASSRRPRIWSVQRAAKYPMWNRPQRFDRHRAPRAAKCAAFCQSEVGLTAEGEKHAGDSSLACLLTILESLLSHHAPNASLTVVRKGCSAPAQAYSFSAQSSPRGSASLRAPDSAG